MNYEALYNLLFDRITDAIHSVERGEHERAMLTLVTAHQEAEELYLLQLDSEQEDTQAEKE